MSNEYKDWLADQEQEKTYIIKSLFNNNLTDISDLEIELDEDGDWIISYHLLDVDGWLFRVVKFDPITRKFKHI